MSSILTDTAMRLRRHALADCSVNDAVVSDAVLQSVVLSNDFMSWIWQW